jgi:hypothetical protein
MDHSEGAERAFCRRQARRLLAYADSCRERWVAGTLLQAAEYFLDRIESGQPQQPTAQPELSRDYLRMADAPPLTIKLRR